MNLLLILPLTFLLAATESKVLLVTPENTRSGSNNSFRQDLMQSNDLITGFLSHNDKHRSVATDDPIFHQHPNPVVDLDSNHLGTEVRSKKKLNIENIKQIG